MNELKRNGSGYYDETAYKALTNVEKERKEARMSEALIKNLKAKHAELQNDCTRLKGKNNDLRKQLAVVQRDALAISVERDLYKSLYENLLNKLIGA